MAKIYTKQIFKRITIIACGCIAFACSNGDSSNNNSKSKWSQVEENFINTPGVYTGKHQHPGARSKSNTWLDKKGNLWMFGGEGIDSANNYGNMNDLWKYIPSNSQWVHIKGSTTINASPAGTKGEETISNTPGAKRSSATWIDSDDNLWMFGGFGLDSSNQTGNMNDLWKFNTTNQLWTWIGGSNTINATGTYGTKGDTANAASNQPGARQAASSFVGSNGNFFLFGGYGKHNVGDGYFNDLWIYDFKLTPNSWVWISGENGLNSSGVYPEAPSIVSNQSYMPSGRNAATNWVDSSGNLWLFGGFGLDSSGDFGYLNDLWMCVNPINYSAANSPSWAWVSGSKTKESGGVYGKLNVPSKTNVPSARFGASSWVDSSGNLWLFGGFGYDNHQMLGYLNDLWVFNTKTLEWTWVGGSDKIDSYGITIGAREFSNTWFDQSGNLWLFGGRGWNNNGTQGFLNDLWIFRQ